jgi:pyruvate kinase
VPELLQDHIKQIMSNWRQVSSDRIAKLGNGTKQYTTQPGIMCSIRGPEVRTTMLRDHKPLSLSAGQEIILVATTDAGYQGYMDPGTKECRVGILYADLVNAVGPGGSGGWWWTAA